MSRLAFYKGHATRNDFVLIDDPAGEIELTPTDVAKLCDRRVGIGADGVLRVVKAEQVAEWTGDPGLWFMDYRNADGSIAEMCGNGLRLFANFLVREQRLPAGRFQVATRAGVKDCEVLADGLVRVNLGQARLDPAPVTVTVGTASWPGTVVDVGNPHAVCYVTDAELAALDLSRSPKWSEHAGLAAGANVEFVVIRAEGSLQLRVYERGVGETQSCGTGVVAAASAYLARAAGIDTVEVRVPGGVLRVEPSPQGTWLTGPATLTAQGNFLG
ncbi:MAG: diaminopimelate epimerase [Arachnia propionica]|nr:MAG: diaminopimelate epimerase [Arachnia propionica]